MKPLVYVAGPYTHPDPVENTHRALKAADLLMERGLVTPLVPHLSLTWHLVSPKAYQQWLDYDLELLRRCDAVIRLAGESPGADGEIGKAIEWGIPVFHDYATLATWAEREADKRRLTSRNDEQ